MRILSGRSIGTGSSINGECLMLDRNGNYYACIDNKYHPNPGTEETGYSEIERTVDWLYANNIRSVKHLLDKWVAIRVAYEVEDDINISYDDTVLNVMYSDLYQPCENTLSAINKAYETCQDSNSRVAYMYTDEVDVARKITSYLNENFLRVRAGGKLNPQGTNSIYFRISSHGYDWHNVIVDFLWDTFQSPKDMPSTIWIGHDAETNPPETVLFEGTPDELLELYDSTVFASDDIIGL